MLVNLLKLSKISLDKDFQKIDIRVLLVMMSEFAEADSVPINQVVMAKELGVTRASINRAFQLLLRKNVLTIVGKKGRHHVYGMTSEYIFDPTEAV